MSYWQGHAPGYSREVERASEAVREAEKALIETMLRAYPIGCPVRVVHHRGTYTGTVDGVDKFGVRVAVRNDRTGKVQKWWAAHVELAEAGEPERCESGSLKCGPVEHHDSEGVPLCAKCWQSLLDDATTQPEDAE